MKAIQNESFGNPAEVMKLVDVPDVGAPGNDEVVIALEASPINMSDLLMISGRYGYRPIARRGLKALAASWRSAAASHLKAATAPSFLSVRCMGGQIKADARLAAARRRRRQPAGVLGINPATAGCC